MCKVFIIKDASRLEKMYELINAVADRITLYNRDGFGWAARDSSGEIIGERTTDTLNFKTRIYDDPSVPTEIDGWEGVIRTYERFGTGRRIAGPMILHGRKSTNQVNLVNTHPLHNDAGWYLIHNGVVANHGPEYRRTTTNDTEHLLHHLSSGGIEAVAKHVSGYYAIGAIDPNGGLHVARADAPLVVCWIMELESVVYATDAELIRDVCRTLGWKHTEPRQIENGYYHYHALNQKAVIKRFEPRKGYSKHQHDMRGISTPGYQAKGMKGSDYVGPNTEAATGRSAKRRKWKDRHLQKEELRRRAEDNQEDDNIRQYLKDIGHYEDLDCSSCPDDSGEDSDDSADTGSDRIPGDLGPDHGFGFGSSSGRS